jgi:ARG and Rhodanese-Phosphatase-superfamily-associated Protein domain
MERSSLSAIATGLLGIFGILGFVWATPGSSGFPSSHPEGGWRLLEPVTYENISIFPVVTSSTQDTSPFLTLDEGLSSGEVIVSEQGATGLARTRGGRPVAVPQYDTSASVNQLVLINRSKRLLLLLAGELVSGGKQDRIIAKDRIVAPGADPLPLDVFCVEHGRWSSGSQFAASKTIVHPSVREQAAVKQSQTDVWAAVTEGSTAQAAPTAPRASLSADSLSSVMREEAPTQSYDKIYKSRRVGGSIDSFVDEVQRRFAKATSGLKGEHVVGVVVAYGGEVAWSDIFASGDLFHLYWSKLLRSYAVEALARPTLREVASADDAQEFLRHLNGREIQESEPGVYRWREITEGQLAVIELDALQPKPITLHRLFLHRTT